MADERVAQFLRGMDIKKASIGGFDKVATFEKFKELVALYEQIIEENRQEVLEEAEQRFNSAPVMQPEDTERLNELQEETKQKDARIAVLEEKLEEYHYSIKDYDKRTDELQNEVYSLKKENADKEEQLQREKEQILNEARSQASQICKDAQSEALRHRASVIEDVTEAKRQKKEILAELMLVQDQLNELMANAVCGEK